MIKIDNISKRYPKAEKYALDKVSLEINTGEAFGILGPNGAGKTTLMGIITTLILPTEGNVYVDGEMITRNRIDIKRKVSLVTQHVSIRRDMTVSEAMELAGRLYGMPVKQIKARTKDILEFTGLYEKKKQVARGLSGGMQRKLMICRALLTNPKIIVLDEPTVGLDPHSRRKIWDLLEMLKQKGITILLTTHYIEEAQSICDRVALISNGRASEVNTPDNMISRLGSYTVDIYDGITTKSYFFDTKEEAIGFAGDIPGKTKLRETTLEDVFLDRMGTELGEKVK